MSRARSSRVKTDALLEHRRDGKSLRTTAREQNELGMMSAVKTGIAAVEFIVALAKSSQSESELCM